MDNLGNGTVLIYNDANIFHKMNNTGRLNIHINSKPLGQIRPKEYVVVNLSNGKHRFKVMHIDVVKMRSQFDVAINNETKIIRVKPTLTSNKLEVTNESPSNFEKFKYAEKDKKRKIFKSCFKRIGEESSRNGRKGMHSGSRWNFSLISIEKGKLNSTSSHYFKTEPFFINLPFTKLTEP